MAPAGIRLRRWVALLAALALLLAFVTAMVSGTVFRPADPPRPATDEHRPPDLPHAASDPVAPSPAAPAAPEADPAPPPDAGPIWIEGTLLGPDGSPVAGAPVRLGRHPDREAVESWRRGASQSDFVIVAGRVLVHGEVVARTDADGRFAVPTPEAGGRHDLHLGDLAGTLLSREDLEFRPGGHLNLGVLILPSRGSLFGRVVDTRSRPVPSFKVVAWRTDVGIPLEDLGMARVPKLRMLGRITAKSARAGPSTWTGEDGSFELRELPPGRWTVRALAGGAAATAEDLELPDGTRIGPVTLRVPVPEPPLLAGRVVDAETGEPRQVRFRLQIEFEAGRDDEKLRGMSAPIATAPDGTFRVSGLQPGKYVIEVFSGAEPTTSGPHVLAEGQSIEGIEIRVPHEK